MVAATRQLGNGVYSLPEAAKLIGVKRRKLAAWFEGWPGGREAIFSPEYESSLSGEPTISFLDLVDASVAAMLREHVSTHTIRKLRGALVDLWKTHHPFGRQEFYTDDTGTRVFIEIAQEEDEESQFIEILKRQHAMPSVLKPSLKHLEYSHETGFAERLQLIDGVVIDPRRRYGKPIVVDSGVPTAVLFEAFKSSRENVDLVAAWYGVESEEVRAAVSFETGFSGIAA
ncbi:MAG: DUF433 domain-containing protein [Planctomycetota bacterium]